MANELSPTDSPTLRAHKRQFIWQILLPILLVVLLILTAEGFVIATKTSDARLWADISTVWLLLPAIALGLLCAVTLGFAIYGLAKLLRVAPRYTAKAQQYTGLASLGIRRVAEAVVKPFLWLAEIRGVFEFFFKPPSDKEGKG